MVNGRGDTPNTHDILTGSQLDGTAFTDGQDHTCNNWTSNSDRLRAGRSSRPSGRRHESDLVEQRAPVEGLQPGGPRRDGRRGLFYCFAAK